MKRFRKRRHHSRFFREARALALASLAVWWFGAGALVALATSGQQAASPARPLADQQLVRDGAKLAADPIIGPTLAPGWDLAGEPLEGLHERPDAPPLRRSGLATRLAAITPTPGVGSVSIPILMYHYTPADFDAQLAHLQERGYEVIDLDTAVAGLAGGPLPPKPAVITFDDGFANQMTAYEILAARRMKATFYIINGSERSLWCIGANRRERDPLQPPAGCGDAYLTWDQIRYLDASGLITIGGHTFDHPNLTTLDDQELRRQLAGSKAEIEQQLGHGIDHFAYPYGAYNGRVLAATREAGYISAVSVDPGVQQTFAGRFGLYRVRTTYDLP